MNLPVTLQRFWIQLTSDRKRFGLLCAMLTVGLLLWARLIVITNTPRTVVADAPDGAVAAAGPTVTTTQHERHGEPVQVVLDREPQRDPFVISTEHFPKLAVVSDFDGEAGKFKPQPVEDSVRAEQQRVARILQVVDRLKLEAVMSGASLAVLNSRTYRVGDEVPVPGEDELRLRLVEVKERSVVLELEGRRFERVLPTPGSAP